MSIKNWFVRSERLKDKHNGLIRYSKYLISAEHANHKNTDKIIPIYNTIENFIQICSNECINLDLENSQKRAVVLCRAMHRVLFLVFLIRLLNLRQNNGSL